MRGRASGCLGAGAAVWVAALLLAGSAPVLANEPSPSHPGPTVSASPSVEPSPTPEPQPSVEPSPTAESSPPPSVEPTEPGPAASPTPSGSPPSPPPTLPGVVPGTAGAIAHPRLAQAGATASVAAVDDAFEPSRVVVTVGTTVVWTNEGRNPHTVTANDRSFDSGTLMPGERFSVSFDEVGHVPYYCQIHGQPGSGMTGLVIVRVGLAEEAEGTPDDDVDVLAATGADPIALVVAAFLSAVAGIAVLRALRRTEGR